MPRANFFPMPPKIQIQRDFNLVFRELNEEQTQLLATKTLDILTTDFISYIDFMQTLLEILPKVEFSEINIDTISLTIEAIQDFLKQNGAVTHDDISEKSKQEIAHNALLRCF